MFVIGLKFYLCITLGFFVLSLYGNLTFDIKHICFVVRFVLFKD